MGAIFRREFKSYFQSPIGYICLAVFWVISGWSFYASSIMTATADLRSVFNTMGTISIFVIPIITMRLFSEEKRQKTEQALLTAPVSLWGIVMGKFLSAFCIYALGVSISLVYAVTLAALAAVEWAVVIGMVAGMLLMGGAMIAIGMLVSSFTENQIVAAVASFAAMLLISIIEFLPQLIKVNWLKNIVAALSFDSRFSNFTLGVFDLPSAVFFLSVIFIFCLLTVRVFEKRRYA